MLPWLRARVAERTGSDVAPRPRATGGAAPVRLHRAGDPRAGRRRAQRSRTWTPLARPSPGRATTPNARGSATGRSAGSSTTRWPSPTARCGAADGTPGSSSTRRAMGTDPAGGAWRIETTCRSARGRGAAPRTRRVRAADGAHAGLRRRPARDVARRGAAARTAERRGGRPPPDDGGRSAPRARCLRAVVRRGMMAAMPSPAPALLTSLANPRVKAAAALRDRRDRDRTGLTLIDGARELRRALDGGVEVVEAFVCEPLLAGPDARAALDLLRALGVDDPAGERGRSSPRSRSASARRVSSPSSASPRRISRDSRCPRMRSSWSSRASRSPATSGRSSAAPMAPGADAVIAASPRTDLFNPNAIRASAGTVFAVPLAAAPTADVLAWLARARLADRGGACRAERRRTPTST